MAEGHGESLALALPACCSGPGSLHLSPALGMAGHTVWELLQDKQPGRDWGPLCRGCSGRAALGLQHRPLPRLGAKSELRLPGRNHTGSELLL